jgi:hypothetical protein
MPPVPAPSHKLGGVGFRTAVAERDEDVEDNVLEEAVITLHKAGEQLLGEGGLDLSISGVDRLLRRGTRNRQLFRRLWLRDTSTTRASRAELDVLRELLEPTCRRAADSRAEQPARAR